MRAVTGLMSVLGLLAGCGTLTEPIPDPRPVPTECAKAEFEKLLWLPQSALDTVTLPPRTRVILPGMAVTLDYSESRLNILVGKSGRIERVYCG